MNTTQALTPGQCYYVNNVAGTSITYNGVTHAAGSVLCLSDTAGTPTAFTSTTTPAGEVALTENATNPYYKFGTDGLTNSMNVTAAATDALSLINVVPNPYYAYDSYEKKQTDNWVKITNLPPKCVVSIYTLNGTLIRRFNRDVASNLSDGAVTGPSVGTEAGSGNYDTSLDWDMKNQRNIPIGSGVYLIHIKADGLGEKVLKWFGVMRPVDLDSF